MPMGSNYTDESWRYRYAMPPPGGWGVKAATPELEQAQDAKTSTPPVNNGEGNIAGAGTPYMPELQILIGGDLA